MTCYDLWWWWPLAIRLEKTGQGKSDGEHTTKGQGELEEQDHMQRCLLTRLHRWETGSTDRMKWGKIMTHYSSESTLRSRFIYK